MLYETLRHIRNFYALDCYEASYTIANGTISLPFAEANQYILIEGSKFNDGVYKYPLSNMKNETFNGYISPLAIPPDLLQLVTEMEAWQANYTPSAYTSESFGGYSYSKASAGGGVFAAFKERLKVYKKL